MRVIQDSKITEKLYSYFNLDIDGYPFKNNNIEILNIEYSNGNFIENIFIDFFKAIESNKFYITYGYNITRSEKFLEFNKNDFIDFIQDQVTINNDGFVYDINLFLLAGILIFDDNFNWMIHYHPDNGDIELAYEINSYIPFKYLPPSLYN